MVFSLQKKLYERKKWQYFVIFMFFIWCCYVYFMYIMNLGSFVNEISASAVCWVEHYTEDMLENQYCFPGTSILARSAFSCFAVVNLQISLIQFLFYY